MDLEQTRYLDFPGLQRYCHLVAGVVGEVAARIFGQTQPQTTEYAHKLGLAFQLTNIIRDVGEDAMRGRIYLPVNELQQFDVKAHEILQRKHSDRFVALMRSRPSARTRLYDEALALLPAADRRAQKPGLMMASIYRTLLREIEARRLPGAEPARQPDAACASCGWPGRCRRWAGCECGGASPSSAPAGPAWPPPSPRRARARGHACSKPRARSGGRARTLPVDAARRQHGAAGQRPAHPDRRLRRDAAR